MRGIQTLKEANQFLRRHYIAEFNRKFKVRGAEPGHAFVPYRGKDLENLRAATAAAWCERKQKPARTAVLTSSGTSSTILIELRAERREINGNWG